MASRRDERDTCSGSSLTIGASSCTALYPENGIGRRCVSHLSLRAGASSCGTSIGQEMEYEDQFERLAQRGTDYDELLRFGSITRQVDDPDAWRRTLKAKARADKLHVRTVHSMTGLLGRRSSIGRPCRGTCASRSRAPMFRRKLKREQRCAATRLRDSYEPTVSRAIARCARCGRRLYIDVEPAPPVIVREVFDEDCR